MGQNLLALACLLGIALSCSAGGSRTTSSNAAQSVFIAFLVQGEVKRPFLVIWRLRKEQMQVSDRLAPWFLFSFRGPLTPLRDLPLPFFPALWDSANTERLREFAQPSSCSSGAEVLVLDGNNFKVDGVF